MAFSGHERQQNSWPPLSFLRSWVSLSPRRCSFQYSLLPSRWALFSAALLFCSFRRRTPQDRPLVFRSACSGFQGIAANLSAIKCRSAASFLAYKPREELASFLPAALSTFPRLSAPEPELRNCVAAALRSPRRSGPSFHPRAVAGV